MGQVSGLKSALFFKGFHMANIEELSTPSLILDKGIMQRNIDRMVAVSERLGVPLRPHGKTPKCAVIGRKLTAKNALGLTVSTLAEAEEYFEGGISDIFYAVGISADKVKRIQQLQQAGAEIKCLVDHPETARQVSAAATRAGATINLVIEIDVDGYRAGVSLEDPAFLELAKNIRELPGLSFAGIMSYGGASYGCTSDEACALAEKHRQELLKAKSRLAGLGLECGVISFGSTPATLHAKTMEGVTELRCGIYAFQDLFQAAIGACAKEDIAVSVLTTVIGVRKDINRVVVDAGGLALSKDLSTAKTNDDAGYGLVCDAESGLIIDDVFIDVTSQELGLITTRSGGPLPFEKFPVGSKVRILPNHADMTAAAYERYHVVDGDAGITDVWERKNGW